MKAWRKAAQLAAFCEYVWRSHAANQAKRMFPVTIGAQITGYHMKESDEYG